MAIERLTYPYRRAGLDHDWFRHEPTLKRPRVTWPAAQPVALWITVPVEYFPLDAPPGPFRPLGGLTLGYPDFWNFSNRDYGLRIGIYRIMSVLDDVGLRATAAVNASVAVRYPRVVDEMLEFNWEFVANGVDMGHVHHGNLAPDDEREWIRSATDVLVKATGSPVHGWHSPGRSHSSSTMELLAERGFRYVTDWANDDMPYAITTAAGELWAMPLTYEWSDRCLLVQHSLTVEDYVEQVVQAFSRLRNEAAQFRCGRILSLSITPWILGYPHRIAALDRLLRRILGSGDVWPATALEIIDIVEQSSRAAS